MKYISKIVKQRHLMADGLQCMRSVCLFIENVFFYGIIKGNRLKITGYLQNKLTFPGVYPFCHWAKAGYTLDRSLVHQFRRIATLTDISESQFNLTCLCTEEGSQSIRREPSQQSRGIRLHDSVNLGQSHIPSVCDYSNKLLELWKNVPIQLDL